MVARYPNKKLWRSSSLPKINVIDVEGRWDHKSEDEFLWWPRIIWIDPGVVSGVAVFWFDPQAVLDGKPLPRQLLAYSEMFLSGPESGRNGQVNRFMRMRKTLDQETGLATGIESFVPRKFSQDPAFLSPVRIRAGIEERMGLLEGEPTLHAQSPSDALTSFNNERLRALGLYTPGPDHINDAKRHGLLWIRKLRTKGKDGIVDCHGNEPDWWS